MEKSQEEIIQDMAFDNADYHLGKAIRALGGANHKELDKEGIENIKGLLKMVRGKLYFDVYGEPDPRNLKE